MSDGLSYLQLLAEGNELNGECLRSNLKFVDTSRLFATIDENGKLADIVTVINTKLHPTENERHKALLLLEKFLPQCPSDTFADYAAGWMLQCCIWSQQTVNDELTILRRLIEYSIHNPDVKKRVTANLLPRFMERLMCESDASKSTTTVVLKLRCVKSLLDFYGSSCGPHRGSLHKYTMYCLKEYQEQRAVIHEAAMCFVALCQCGSKGQQGINFKEVWSSQFKMLISTCHKLIDSLYSNVNFVSLAPEADTSNACPGLTDMKTEYEKTPLMRYYGLKIGFSIAAELLQAMLLCSYSVSKSFEPNDVFNLVCRVLSVTGTMLQECVQTNDILALAAHIPDVHTRAFDILEAVIISSKRNMIPYGVLICKLCLQSLKWTHSPDWKYGSSKPYESLRCKVYSVLSSWSSISGHCSSIEIFADEFIPLIISDIEFVKPSLKLTVSSNPSMKKNKRKHAQLAPETNAKSEATLLIDPTANRNVCLEAHRALQALLRSASVFVKWEHHKTLQYVVLPLVLEMFDCASTAQHPLPYSDVKCRLELYRSLFTLVSEPHPKWTAPVSLAGRIMNVGAHDADVEVASFCRFASSQLEIAIHPRCPTLYFARPENEKSTAAVSKSSDWFPKNDKVDGPRVDFGALTDVEKMVVDETSKQPAGYDGVVAESQSTPSAVSGQTLSSSETPARSDTASAAPAENAVDSTNAAKRSIALESPEPVKRTTAELVEANTIKTVSPEKQWEASSVVSGTAIADISSPPPCKKLKSDAAIDEKVQSMLNAFEDILA